MKKHRAKKRALKVLEDMGNVALVTNIQGQGHFDEEWQQISKPEETDSGSQERVCERRQSDWDEIKSEDEFDEFTDLAFEAAVVKSEDSDDSKEITPENSTNV